MKSIIKMLSVLLVTVMLLSAFTGCSQITAKYLPSSYGEESSNTTSAEPNNQKNFINLEQSNKGAISVATSYAAPGTIIPIAVAPKKGYEVTGVSVKKEGETTLLPVVGKEEAFTFTMPNGNVDVKANYAQKSVTARPLNSSVKAAVPQPNLFSGATATTNNANSSYPVGNAFDGGATASSNRWVTAPGGANPAVVTITLPSPVEIGSIIIRERYFGGDPDARGRLTKFSVYSVSDSNVRTPIIENLDPTAVAKDDITSHIINFEQLVMSKTFELKIGLHAKALTEGANIIEIEAFGAAQTEPIPTADPDAPEGTKDFAVGGTIVPSSEMAPSYAASAATLPYDPYYATEQRWGANTEGEDVIAEITFVEPAMINFVKVVQYEGPKPSGWGTGKRMSNVKIELADDGDPYTIVASGEPSNLDATNVPFVPSGVVKTLETPMRAVRMRVTMTPNNNGRAEGLNIKALEAYGVTATVPAPQRNEQLKKVLNAAYSKNAADYTPESWAAFTPLLIATRAVYSAGDSATPTQVTEAINNMIDVTYALQKKTEKVERLQIAFVGDSITYGHFLPDPAKQCFSATVQEKLGKVNYDVKNFAISGRTLSSKSDLPYMKETLYKQSLSYVPDVVVIMLGTNDSKSRYNLTEAAFAADARTLINSYKLLDSQPIIYFNTSPKALHTLGDGGDAITPNGVKKVAGWQKTIAQNVPDIYQMDIFTETANFKDADYIDNGLDGVHPSKQGHDKLANMIVSNFDKTKPMLIKTNKLFLLTLVNLDENGYKPEIWKTFADARTKLQSLLNSKTSSAQEIVDARKALDAAYKTLADNIDNTKVRIACVGDSITRGDGAGQFIYPTYLQNEFNKVEANRFIVENYGENGMMASDRQGCGLTDPTTSGGYYPYYDKYTASLGFLPTVVTIKLGTNDAKYIGENAPKYKDDMKKIIAAYQALPSKPLIIIVTSAWAQETPGQLTADWANAINKQIVPLQIELAKELKLPLININQYTKYSYDNGLSKPPSDGIHGNYRTISEGMWAALMGDGKIGGSSFVLNDPAGAFKAKY